jgi:hypothetical protein
MIIILASRYDRFAQELARDWAVYDARVLICADLSTAGWRHQVGVDNGTAVIGGEVIPTSEVRGILVRLPLIDEWELVHIVAADRSYVAAEINAFLRCWLAELRCPVLNRPTPTALSGPAWRPEHWIHTAARLGIPVRPLRQHVRPGELFVPDSSTPSDTCVTVAGDRCIGRAADELVQHARALASAAGVELLAVEFTGEDAGARMIAADPWPDITAPEIVEAIGAYLSRGSLCSSSCGA